MTKLCLYCGYYAAIVAGHITGSPKMDIFFNNENGPNFLFKNRGDGNFDDVAYARGIADESQNGRGRCNCLSSRAICHGMLGRFQASVLSFCLAGTTLVDHNEDGRFDILYGNWNGPHRLFVQNADGSFTDIGQVLRCAVFSLHTKRISRMLTPGLGLTGDCWRRDGQTYSHPHSHRSGF
jgi:hypothetical protein